MAANAIVYNTFRQEAFSGLTLTEQVNKYPYVPSLLGQLDLFEPIPLRTIGMQINERDGQLVLVPTSARGGESNQRVNDLRKARTFNVPRISFADTIYSEELQGVVSDDPNKILKTLQEEVARRVMGPTGLTKNIEYTWEYHRLGAIQGILYDAPQTIGGTLQTPVLYNWFTQFGISPQSEVVFNLAANVASTLRPLLNGLIRTMRTAAKGAWIEGITQCHALCGHEFFDLFTNHQDVVKTYVNWNEASELRNNQAFDTFFFGGIYWHDYRGSDDGTSIAVPTNYAYFFPKGSPGTFRLGMAPAEGFPNLNEPGRPMTVYRDMDMSEKQAWVKYEVATYPLHVCTRPEMLIKGTADSTAD